MYGLGSCQLTHSDNCIRVVLAKVLALAAVYNIQPHQLHQHTTLNFRIPFLQNPDSVKVYKQLTENSSNNFLRLHLKQGEDKLQPMQ